MKIGLQLPNFTLPEGPQALGGHLREVAVRAEQAGFSSLWVMDHFFQIPHLGSAENEMLEAYSALGFLAACTTRIELGTLVTGVTYRHPGILAKTVATLDVLSGGRAWLGIGAGWYEKEHHGLGIPFPSVAERFERLEETIQVCLSMWSEEVVEFAGKHYRLKETLCRPRPLRRPPILIGGLGEKKTLKLVARYGQACNLFEHCGLETLRRKLDILERHCREESRDYNSVSKTVLGQTSLQNEAAADKLIVKLEAMQALGFDTAIYAIKDPTDFKSLDLFGERVIPAVT